MSFFAIVGEGPNGLEIPLVICRTEDEAKAIVRQIPQNPKHHGWLDEDFYEKSGRFYDEDADEEATEEGQRLYSLIFKDGNYYSGCGGCYMLHIKEYAFGQAMVAWDLD